MGEKIPTRQEALELLHQYNESDSLRKHAYAVSFYNTIANAPSL